MKINKYIYDYLKFKGIKINRNSCECPICKTPACQIRPVIDYSLFCMKCQIIGTIYDVVRKLEKSNDTNEQIEQYITKLLNLDIITDTDIEKALNFYEQNKFDLVPIAVNNKIPVEKEWTTKEHKDKTEWKKWLESDLNIGVKTGKISNITVIDIDTKEISEQIKGLLDFETLIQETKNGWHFFYQYDSELPKTRIDELKIDIENDGGQIVIFPSIVEDNKRKFNFKDIKPLPSKLKDFIKTNISFSSKTENEILEEEIITEKFHYDLIKEGNRHNILMHVGGILRKKLNVEETSFVLDIINKKLTSPSLNDFEFRNITKSLDKYKHFDDLEIATKILNYLRIIEDATARDVREALGFKKEDIDKSLQHLVKEGFLLKKRRMFHIIKRADWKDHFPNLDNEIKFKMPYFYDYAVFNWGDMLLLGSRAKWGKTTISVNMVEDFVRQGIKPYYISLETGSRFIKTALKLGLKEGDFYWCFEANPTKIELEKNAITILDWLLIEDKSQSDAVLKHFVEQLFKSNGILIVFMQLKSDNSWFAPNMVGQFPSLMARYLYDDEQDGTTGKWKLDVIREPKFKTKEAIVPCKYDWDTRRLKRIDENNTNIND